MSTTMAQRTVTEALIVVLAFTSLVLAVARQAPTALAMDDVCLAGSPACALGALQQMAVQLSSDATAVLEAEGAVGEAEDAGVAAQRLATQEILARRARGHASALAEAQRRIPLNTSVPAGEPYWDELLEEVRRSLTQPGTEGGDWAELCAAGRLEDYTAKGCAPDAAGSTPLNGSLPVDAIYCGSKGSGIAWSSGMPVSDLCTAEPGSAYGAKGVCGSLGSKELALNYFLRGPRQWAQNVEAVNIPSLDCIMGLGDCDIYYCQHCRGRCGP